MQRFTRRKPLGPTPQEVDVEREAHGDGAPRHGREAATARRIPAREMLVVDDVHVVVEASKG